MKFIVEIIIKIAGQVLTAVFGYLGGRSSQAKKQAKANYEASKKNADIASSADIDDPVERL